MYMHTHTYKYQHTYLQTCIGRTCIYICMGVRMLDIRVFAHGM